MPATRILAAAFVTVFLAGSTAASAQPPSFARSDIATGVSLLGPVIPGDFNNDGRPDLLVTTHSLAENFGIYILFGHADGIFDPPFRAFSPPAGSGLGTADLNGDGRLDLLFLVGPEMWVLLGNGDGSFGQPTFSNHPPSGRPPVIVDLDRDGKLDVAFITQDGPIAVSLGNGDGTFRQAISSPVNSDHGVATALAAGDFNGDGVIDLVATNDGFPLEADGSTVSILLGRGDGTFAPPTDVSVGTTPVTLAPGDFNHDGHVDLAVGNYQSPSLSVLIGRGDGTFLPRTDYPIGLMALGTAAADFNGDGPLDLAACSPPDVLSLFAGRGDGTFGMRRDLFAASDCESIAVGDFNLDGRPDLALTYSGGLDTLSIFLNTTAPADTIPPTITASATPSVLWPPNGKTVRVVVSGTVTDAGSGVDLASVRFDVRDEYGRVQPKGRVTIGADGHYSVVIPLVASRRGRDARTYTIAIRAQDRAGNSASAHVIVNVPHDRGGKRASGKRK
jgi:hypothetical protein